MSNSAITAGDSARVSVRESYEFSTRDFPEPDILRSALLAAIEAAKKGPLAGGNPRVGCVIIAEGTRKARIVATGYHRGAGSAHAEVDALSQLSDASADDRLTAVITLEPCNHTGRTDPCTRALVRAGVRNVVYAVADPNMQASGGAQFLRAAGVNVASAAELGLDLEVVKAAQDVTAQWRCALKRGRPWTIGKVAQSLDGYVAAADGTSQWITGAKAREYAHYIRHEVDAIVVGTGTVIADDPTLSARAISDGDQPQPIIIGQRELPDNLQLFRNPALLIERTRDLAGVLERAFVAGARRLLIEGGPTLISAALKAGLLDELHIYVAPVLLGGGKSAFKDIGVTTLRQAVSGCALERHCLGADELTIMRLTDTNDPQNDTQSRNL